LLKLQGSFSCLPCILLISFFLLILDLSSAFFYSSSTCRRLLYCTSMVLSATFYLYYTSFQSYFTPHQLLFCRSCAFYLISFIYSYSASFQQSFTPHHSGISFSFAHHVHLSASFYSYSASLQHSFTPHHHVISFSFAHLVGLISFILLIVDLFTAFFYSSSSWYQLYTSSASISFILLLFGLNSSCRQLLFCTPCWSYQLNFTHIRPFFSLLLLLIIMLSASPFHILLVFTPIRPSSAFFYSSSACYQIIFCMSCASYHLHFTHIRPLFSVLLLLIIMLSASLLPILLVLSASFYSY
jgi:hypothetical protein